MEAAQAELNVYDSDDDMDVKEEQPIQTKQSAASSLGTSIIGY